MKRRNNNWKTKIQNCLQIEVSPTFADELEVKLLKSEEKKKYKCSKCPQSFETHGKLYMRRYMRHTPVLGSIT